MTKWISGFIIFSVYSQVAFATLNMAESGPTMDDVNRIRPMITSLIPKEIRSSSGITGCETQSGMPFIKMDGEAVAKSKFENCLHVVVYQPRQKMALERLIRPGMRFAGIYVVFD